MRIFKTNHSAVFVYILTALFFLPVNGNADVVVDPNMSTAPMSGDTSGTLPTADNSAAPINEGRDMDVGSHRAAPIGDAEESGGPAATDHSDKGQGCVDAIQNNANLLAELQSCRATQAELQSAVNRAESEKGELTTAVDTLTAEKGELTTAVDTLTAEKGELTTTVDTLTAEKGELTTAVDTLTAEKGELTTAVDTLTAEKGELNTTVDTLTAEKGELQAAVNRAESEKGELQAAVDKAHEENLNMKDDYERQLSEATAAQEGIMNVVTPMCKAKKEREAKWDRLRKQLGPITYTNMVPAKYKQANGYNTSIAYDAYMDLLDAVEILCSMK